MDLAKMLAVLDLIEPLAGADFHIWRQTRTGLLSYPLNLPAARAHLAASIYLQMALKPHIVHIVGHTEADHAATASDVIESAAMAQRVIENSLRGAPDLTADPAIQQRKVELMEQAQVLLQAIRSLGRGQEGDPLTNPQVLQEAVTRGLMDAPQLKNNPFGRGRVRTRLIQGACQAVDEANQGLSEDSRLSQILKEHHT